MIGQGTSNGHAIIEDDRALVWIPLEAYSTERQVGVFLTHEIVHGLHYLSRPEYFFHTHEEKNHLGRQLMTEGVALYVTKTLMSFSAEDALWADYIPEAECMVWMNACVQEQPALRTFMREHWNDIDGLALDLFFANDPDDIYRYRAGYFIALSIIESIVATRGLDLQALLATPRTQLEEWCLSTL